MRINVGDKAPYAPGQVIIDLIRRQRQMGTLKSVDAGLLERLGVTESLRPRTMASLRQLGLIDEDGNVTAVMEGFKRGSEDEYRGYLTKHLKDVYGEVFDVLGDVSDATPEAVDTAFRGYEPHGQRGRMVVLFLSLCQEAGLVQEVVRERASSVSRATRSAGGNGAAKKPNRKKASPQEEPSKDSTPTPPAPPALPSLDPLISAYVAKLPPSGSVWPHDAREKYLNALKSIFDIVYQEGNEISN